MDIIAASTSNYPFTIDPTILYDARSPENMGTALKMLSIREAEHQEFCTFKQWRQLPNQPGIFRIFTIISVLTILVVLVVLGNALVIAAVILRRRLRSATGLLILSLAVADLLVIACEIFLINPVKFRSDSSYYPSALQMRF